MLSKACSDCIERDAGMDENEWLSRCAAQYMKRIGMSEEDARDAAKAALENLDNDLTENPEDAADEDLSYWQD